MKVVIAIEWKNTPNEGRLEIENGKILGGRVVCGTGRFNMENNSWSLSGPGRLELEVETETLQPGMHPAMIGIRDVKNPFTFFLRDVCREFPIFIPDYGVAVTTAEDERAYDQIEQAVRQKGLVSNYQRIDLEPEESYETAAKNTRELHSPIWLGVSRDIRIFEMGLRQPMLYTDYIQPRFCGYGYFWPESEKALTPPRYGFVMGKGWTCSENVHRRLEEGGLPIIHVRRTDEQVQYEQTAFSTLEKTSLTAKNVRGTHHVVADRLSVCNVFTEAEEKKYLSLREQELNQDQETVFCTKIVATNLYRAPRYAFFKTPFPHDTFGNPTAHGYDRTNGFSLVDKSELVFGISRLNGRPLGQEEIAVLLPPGESCLFEFFIPHRPICRERAEILGKRNIEECLEECKKFWNAKRSQAGTIEIPEERINDMVQASLLHLDLTAYGLEPDGTVAMTDGAYVPVSSEIWVNLNYLDSVGWHSLVRRSLAYYLEKQRDDGFIQTFLGYMLENGAVLLALGEHYRYTRDDAWAKEIGPKVLKQCEFILQWRQKSRDEGKGYGILKGQVADPVDHEQVYMLNAYTYAGLCCGAELLAKTHPDPSKRIQKEADELKADIRKAFLDSLANGPVIPMGDGTWSPTASPWFGPRGPKCLFVDGGCWWTHGSMSARDDMLGPIHLVVRDVFDAGEPEAATILNYESELMFTRNVGSSQPYYSQHPLVHLRRGEVKRFLKTYYNSLTSLADREIYTWWEHYYHESVHKTHEEAQFLMQTRWMLFLEDFKTSTLNLLPGVPRGWLEHGKRIELKKVVSHFGPLDFCLTSKLDQGVIEIRVECTPGRKPRRLEIRVPHPQGKKALRVDAGVYSPERETVVIEDFTGTVTLTVYFQK